jgi:phage terminase large subunit GpA-like protein
MAGANSPASLASRPIRDVLCDEVDRYPVSAGAEGDPVNLAKKRTTTFWNRKIILTSTPTIKGASRIETAYEASDQRRYYVPCPECGKKQPLKWANLIFDDGDPKYACDNCGVLIEEQHKPNMLRQGEWIAEAEFTGRAGFHLNELYSPWRRWSEIVSDFKEAKKSPETLKTWVNTSLGETWEEEGEKADPDSLYARREHYRSQVPDGALVLTAGVDVQDDRLECEVVGWGIGEECWSIDYFILRGDPGRSELWQRLDERLRQTYDRAGVEMRIASTCIDSGGHYTQQVYQFCKKREVNRIYAIKGKSQPGSPIVSRPSTGNAQKVKLFSIGTDTAKELIYARFNVQEPGPGYCHWPVSDIYDPEYFAQITAEKVVTRFHKGFPRREWVKTRPRNEALDCRVYALAAMVILQPNFKALQERAKPEEKQEQVQETPMQALAKQRKPQPRRGGFVNGWRR